MQDTIHSLPRVATAHLIYGLMVILVVPVCKLVVYPYSSFFWSRKDPVLDRHIDQETLMDRALDHVRSRSCQ